MAKDWSPIEGAPNDGTKVLLWAHVAAGGKPFVAIGRFINGWHADSGDIPGVTLGYIPIVPTHWMDLPAPPAKKGRV